MSPSTDRPRKQSGARSGRAAEVKPKPAPRVARTTEQAVGEAVTVRGDELLDRIEQQAQQIARLRARLADLESQLEIEHSARSGLETELARAKEDAILWRSQLGEAWDKLEALQQRLHGPGRVFRRLRRKRRTD